MPNDCEPAEEPGGKPECRFVGCNDCEPAKEPGVRAGTCSHPETKENFRHISETRDPDRRFASGDRRGVLDREMEAG